MHTYWKLSKVGWHEWEFLVALPCVAVQKNTWGNIKWSDLGCQALLEDKSIGFGFRDLEEGEFDTNA